jgi:hypothetical protein
MMLLQARSTGRSQAAADAIYRLLLHGFVLTLIIAATAVALVR